MKKFDLVKVTKGEKGLYKKGDIFTIKEVLKNSVVLFYNSSSLVSDNIPKVIEVNINDIEFICNFETAKKRIKDVYHISVSNVRNMNLYDIVMSFQEEKYTPKVLKSAFVVMSDMIRYSAESYDYDSIVNDKTADIIYDYIHRWDDILNRIFRFEKSYVEIEFYY